MNLISYTRVVKADVLLGSYREERERVRGFAVPMPVTYSFAVPGFGL